MERMIVQAQQLATFSVTITDPTGSVIPGAQVTMTNADAGLQRAQVAIGQASLY